MVQVVLLAVPGLPVIAAPAVVLAGPLVEAVAQAVSALPLA